MSLFASTVGHMAINGSVGPSAEATAFPGTVDVHAHAMPLPLLQRLADRGLADISGVRDGIVRLDPRVSGVGPRAPLPLARSQYDVAVRLAEMDEAGVDLHAVSLPPFLFCTNADDEAVRHRHRRRGQRRTRRLRRGRPRPAGRPRLRAARLAGRRRRGAPLLDELGMAGIAIGSQGGGKDLDDPVNDDLWALLSERGTFVFMHPSGVPDPQRQGLLAAPAGRLPDGDRDRGRPARVRPGAGAVPAEPVPGARRRLPAVVARADGHGLGAQGCRAHHGTCRRATFTDRLYYDTAVFNTDAAAPARRGRRC